MTPRIFVFMPQAHDISKAEKYGDIVYLFDGESWRPSIFEHNQFIDCIVKRLNEMEFDYVRDYFLFVGSMLHNVYLTHVLTANYPHVNCVIFSAQNSDYYIRTFQGNQNATV